MQATFAEVAYKAIPLLGHENTATVWVNDAVSAWVLVGPDELFIANKVQGNFSAVLYTFMS